MTDTELQLVTTFLKDGNFTCGLVLPLNFILLMTTWQVNIGSGNGLVPSGNKPLPEPMLTQF